MLSLESVFLYHTNIKTEVKQKETPSARKKEHYQLRRQRSFLGIGHNTHFKLEWMSMLSL
jgi:hypothetical protein